MSTTSIPVGQAPAAAEPNPLGRIALVIGSAGLLITCLWTIAQMSLVGVMVARQGGETAMELHGTVALAIYVVTFVLALIATILGIKALRRQRLSKVAAAVAVGMSGSALASYAALLIGNVIMALVQH